MSLVYRLSRPPSMRRRCRSLSSQSRNDLYRSLVFIASNLIVDRRRQRDIQRPSSPFIYPSSTGPLMTLGSNVKEALGDGSSIVDLSSFDLAKKALVTVRDTIIPKELVGSRLVGSSHGWGFFHEKRDGYITISDYLNLLSSKSNPNMIHLPNQIATLKKGVVCLQDDLNLTASDSNPKRISLPRLVPLLRCQTQIVTNVAMSSSSLEDVDCVVAVKFLGRQLSMCRPAHDSKWTNIRIEDPSFFASHVMFSHRDQMFSMPASGGNHIGSWDLLKYRDNPKLQKLRLQDLPFLRKKIRQVWDSCYRTEHLVESSAGETFLVIWPATCGTEEDVVDLETKGFRVFRVDEEGNATYTEDIGDLCIFLAILSA